VRVCAGGAKQLASLPRLEVLIEEMNGSDRSRPKDYKRALVATRRPAKKPTLRSGGSIALEKRKGDKKF
jgi:hypothetical protein